MFDNEHILEDGAAGKTASGYGQVDASAQVVDLGAGLIRGNLIVDVTRLAMQGNDQLYQVHLMGGDDASFTKEVALCTLELGPKETIEGNRDSKLGRYVVPLETEKNGIVYPFVRVRHVLSGSGPVINYVCRLEKDLPVRGGIFNLTTTTTT